MSTVRIMYCDAVIFSFISSLFFVLSSGSSAAYSFPFAHIRMCVCRCPMSEVCVAVAACYSLLHAAQKRLSPLCYRATTIGAAIRFCATGSTKKLVNRCRVNAIQCNQIRLVKYSNMAIITDTQMQRGKGWWGEGVSITHESNRIEGRSMDQFVDRQFEFLLRKSQM